MKRKLTQSLLIRRPTPARRKQKEAHKEMKTFKFKPADKTAARS